jgi:hypothetical protein
VKNDEDEEEARELGDEDDRLDNEDREQGSYLYLILEILEGSDSSRYNTLDRDLQN